jgi:hypothetical protein
LFLTYGGFSHRREIRQITKLHNIYIHPKNPEDVFIEDEQYIIPNLVPTEWGKKSIVDATIELLKESYKKEENHWFFLLSQDVYPMVSFANIKARLKEEKKSFFDSIQDDGTFYKTSQWWILSRKDVSVILEHYAEFNEKHKNVFKGIPKLSFETAVDEIYFLSLLKWKNPKYTYNNSKVVYTRWLGHIPTKHPFVYNRLLDIDKQHIEKQGSFFIRKTTATFSPTTYKTNDHLYVLFIGTESKFENYKTILDNPSADIVILSGVPIEDVDPRLLKRCICYVEIYYKLFFEAILILSHTVFKRSLKVWKLVSFVSEKYNSSRHDKDERIVYDFLPKTKFYFEPGQEIANRKFMISSDTNGDKVYTLIY